MLEWLFTQQYFGNSLYQVALFFAAVVASVIIGKIVYYLIKTRARVAAEKSKSRADDLIIETVEKPLVFFLIIIGLGIGTRFLTIPAQYLATMNVISSILVTIGVTWLAINLVDSAVKLYLVPAVGKTKSRLDDQLIPIVSKTLKWLIVAFSGMLILSNFGYDITAILAGLGIGGLAVAFAAQETIADAFGGMNIFVSKPFIVGDWIDFQGIIGPIEKVSIRHTTMRNLDGRKVIIPNSKISKEIIVNISSEPTRKILMNLGLTYETPVAKMKKAVEIVNGVVNKHPGCQDDPIVNFSEFKDFSLNLLVIYFITDKDNWFPIRHEINMKIKEAFEKAKIDFAYPTQLIYTKKS